MNSCIQKKRSRKTNGKEKRCASNRHFIHVKVLGFACEALCFENEHEMNVNNSLEEIKRWYKFEKDCNLYLEDEQNGTRLYPNDVLVHARTYRCKRKFYIKGSMSTKKTIKRYLMYVRCKLY